MNLTLTLTRYDNLYAPIAKEVNQLRVLLQSREAKSAERVWLQRQTHGDLDESRLVDGVAGDRAVYKRRAEQLPQDGAPQLKPKLLRFVMDLSGSMYYFNNHDRRLERSLQTAVMIVNAPREFQSAARVSCFHGIAPCTSNVVGNTRSDPIARVAV